MRVTFFAATLLSVSHPTVYGRGKPAQTHLAEHETPPKPPERLNLTDQYIGLLLLVLFKAGLLDVCFRWIFFTSFYLSVMAKALTSMLSEESTDHSLARKATLLIGEVLQIANKVLPLSVASKIQV